MIGSHAIFVYSAAASLVFPSGRLAQELSKRTPGSPQSSKIDHFLLKLNQKSIILGSSGSPGGSELQN